VNKRQLNILTSPAFIVALCLLLANDFIFKPLLHNWLTGKLSDITGLFIFPLFWVAFTPQYKRLIYALTVFFFLLWKSEYSQPLIDVWNGLSILPISRVVDITDLLALSVLPLSYVYSDHERQGVSYRLAPYVMAVVSLFAFTATSFRTRFDYGNKFYLPDSKIELTRKLYHLSHLNPEYGVSLCASSISDPNDIEIGIPSDFCFGHVKATVNIGEEQGQSVVILKTMEHECPEGIYDKQKLLAIFESSLITKLKQVNLAPSSLRTTGVAVQSASPQLNGAGQLYFVSIGELPQANIEKLANYFRRKYGTTIGVLPALPLTDEARLPNFPNSRPVADRLIEVMKRENPKIASNPKAIVIGITEDMNVSQSNRIYNFSYQSDGRFAVVAIDSMNPATFCEPANQDLLESRLRKVMAKNVGILYYRLPRSENPVSVMYSSLDCVDELDGMGEDF
jgi:hypothetical protein